MKYLAGVLAGMLILAGAEVWILDGRLDDARQATHKAKEQRDEAMDANKAAQKAIAQCQAVNAQNAAQREAVKQRAAAAIARADALAAKLNEVEQIEIADHQCRRLDELLPSSFTRQLCVPGANCKAGDGNH